MTENKNYQQLTRTFQRLSRFSHLGAIAGWDMFAMMPPGSAARGGAGGTGRAAASDPDG
jgi:carboxypeptidase Taq